MKCRCDNFCNIGLNVFLFPAKLISKSDVGIRLNLKCFMERISQNWHRQIILSARQLFSWSNILWIYGNSCFFEPILWQLWLGLDIISLQILTKKERKAISTYFNRTFLAASRSCPRVYSRVTYFKFQRKWSGWWD